jgi:hypothetical protein
MTDKKVATRKRKKTVTESVTPKTKVEDTIPPKAEAPVAEPVEEIETSPKTLKAKLTTERYTKVVAIRNTSGSFGKSRFVLEDGKTYSFPTELANWLIQTGRAK